jgi:hypothetical protein
MWVIGNGGFAVEYTRVLRLRFFHRVGLLVPLLRFHRWAVGGRAA